MPEMHLRQNRFTCSVSGLFPRNKTRTQKFREKRESRYTYRNEIDMVSVSRRRWHTEILKIYQEERFLTKYCVTKHLKLQVITLLQISAWTYINDLRFFDKKARNTTAHTKVGMISDD